MGRIETNVMPKLSLLLRESKTFSFWTVLIHTKLKFMETGL
jgi:hypothetical protein